MTKEEAIEILKTELYYDEKVRTTNTGWERKSDEAHLMAIKALSQEPCDDAIGRAEAMTEIMMFAGNVKPDEEDINIKVSDAVQLLRELPSVTQKSGKWSHDGSHWKNRFICSECNYKLFDEPTNYCPNCGAKMESEDKE